MRPADLPAAGAAAGASFGVDLTDPEDERRWLLRVAYGLETDPGGCFVAELDGEIIGISQAIIRERLWCLSTLAVKPGAQSGGAGRGLLQRALAYDSGTDAGLIVSSADPRALRLYALAGFAMRPVFDATGTVDRRTLPRADRAVREAGADDLEALAAISRGLRGAAHTRELAFQLSRGFHLLRHSDRGLAVAHERIGVWMVAASDEEAASALLWSALALTGELDRPPVRWITSGQDWAIAVLLRAGLQLAPGGALAVRGRPGPLRPYIPSPPFG
jgi:GNAT superfamily N-acetyltransferase